MPVVARLEAGLVPVGGQDAAVHEAHPRHHGKVRVEIAAQVEVPQLRRRRLAVEEPDQGAEQDDERHGDSDIGEKPPAGAEQGDEDMQAQEIRGDALQDIHVHPGKPLGGGQRRREGLQRVAERQVERVADEQEQRHAAEAPPEARRPAQVVVPVAGGGHIEGESAHEQERRRGQAAEMLPLGEQGGAADGLAQQIVERVAEHHHHAGVGPDDVHE